MNERKRPSNIRTTGDLREVLADSIKMVMNGSMDIDKANAMHKLSKNISDSLYSETKIRMFAHEVGESTASMGDMPLGGTVDK